MKKRFKIISVVIILLVLISLPSLFIYLSSIKEHRPNVILITIDALRPDHLGCYCYKRNTSPNIDILAKEGVLFTQAISQGSWTPPSITSIITSCYPSVHGVYNFGMSLNSKIQTLPDILKNNGYYIGLISGRGKLSEFHFPDLEKSFDTFYPPNSNFILADEVTKNTIDWLRLNKNRKFFLWLYYLDPHTPYTSPYPYNTLYINDTFNKIGKKVPIANKSRGLYDGYGVIPRVAAIKGIIDIDYYISQYDGEIRFVDEQIGIVLNELKNLNIYDRTIIAITSDHGESLGEHNFYFVHGKSLYDELLKVPLIIKHKNLSKNLTIHKQVQLIDIMLTILDYIGIIIPKNTQGVSLLPLIRRGDYDIKYAFSETEKNIVKNRELETH